MRILVERTWKEGRALEIVEIQIERGNAKSEFLVREGLNPLVLNLRNNDREEWPLDASLHVQVSEPPQHHQQQKNTGGEKVQNRG